jgi:inner membrane protein
MDPISQAALGAVAPQTLANKTAIETVGLLRIGIIGALAGMAPDLDVLIQSSTDPLLQLEYHRQFTHSLIFIPFGAALCALVFWPFVRSHMAYGQVWFIALLGYGTHGLLDACTTYGTLLLWPFSNARIAWNNVSVIDPLFTLPLLGFVLTAGLRQSRFAARCGLGWAIFYLALGVIQEDRAARAGSLLAASRGHHDIEVSAKPSIGNILLWKTVYEHNGLFWVDAIRVGGSTTIIEGDHVARLDIETQLPWLDPSSQQARDLERFRWFSNDHLAVDKTDPLLIVDMRYSQLPNEITGLWGIRLDPSASSTAHIEWVTRRSADSARIDQLWTLLRGE